MYGNSSQSNVFVLYTNIWKEFCTFLLKLEKNLKNWQVLEVSGCSFLKNAVIIVDSFSFVPSSLTSVKLCLPTWDC